MKKFFICHFRSTSIRFFVFSYFLFIVYFVLYLYSYHIMKSKCEKYELTTNTETVDNFFLGLASGGCVLALTNPIWLSKTRLCLQYEIQSDKKYSGMVNCIYSTARNDGIKSLYKAPFFIILCYKCLFIFCAISISIDY